MQKRKLLRTGSNCQPPDICLTVRRANQSNSFVKSHSSSSEIIENSLRHRGSKLYQLVDLLKYIYLATNNF